MLLEFTSVSGALVLLLFAVSFGITAMIKVFFAIIVVLVRNSRAISQCNSNALSVELVFRDIYNTLV